MNALKKNHFELFSLAPAFALDQQELAEAYRRFQSAVHPDRFAGAGAAQQRLALQLAARANEAYGTLSDPAARARYLCELHGVDLEIESNTAMPADFLLRQLDWRERLDDAEHARDGAALSALTVELTALRGELVATLAQLLDAEQDYPQAAGVVRELLFVDRFASEMERAEDSIAA